jgi:hypothetical protein
MVAYALLVIAGFLLLAYVSTRRGDSRSPSIGSPSDGWSRRRSMKRGAFRLPMTYRAPKASSSSETPIG